jgi:hypothetical protein
MERERRHASALVNRDGGDGTEISKFLHASMIFIALNSCIDEEAAGECLLDNTGHAFG